jgi:hypothetical protein
MLFALSWGSGFNLASRCWKSDFKKTTRADATPSVTNDLVTISGHNWRRQMSKWKGIVAKSFSPAAFDTYCHSLSWTKWRPSFIALHNTASPSLAQRPSGLTLTHIRNLEAFYRDEKGWSAGPHLFVDDLQIWEFTSLTVSGVHSPSWNAIALGIEMLGDFDSESFSSGRGLKVRRNSVAAMVSLSGVLGLDPEGMRLHREDPETTHKCPGKNVKKLEVIQEVQAGLASSHAGEHEMVEAIVPTRRTASKRPNKQAAVPARKPRGAVAGRTRRA